MIRSGVFFAVALLVLSAPAMAQTNSKAAYDELCLSCHKQPQRLSARLANTVEARTKLDEFLIKHYAPDAEKRAAVIDFLYQAK
ncbi:MAG: hypothetical protein Q8M31_09885 [Beijerinckiaceae bacterium]|nr:hypothetical protein [Beijerinckiaceae bacterium]